MELLSPCPIQPVPHKPSYHHTITTDNYSTTNTRTTMRNRFMTTTTNHAFFIAVITICLTATVTSFSELPPFVIQRFRYCCRDLDRYSYRNHHITLFSKWDHIIDEDDDDDDLVRVFVCACVFEYIVIMVCSNHSPILTYTNTITPTHLYIYLKESQYTHRHEIHSSKCRATKSKFCCNT